LKSRILNVLLHQAGWFACVLGAANDRPWTGTIIATAMVVIHLLLVTDRRQEWQLLLAAAILGTVLDTVQGWLGVVRFSSGYVVGWLCPLWVAVLWAQFASLLHISLGWLSRRYLFAGLLGLVGGPVAFFGGARLGAAVLHPDLRVALGALALEWAIALPVMLWLSEKYPVRPGYRGLQGKNAFVRRA
jgi:hypothetical protein